MLTRVLPIRRIAITGKMPAKRKAEEDTKDDEKKSKGATDWSSLDFGSDATTGEKKSWDLKISTWNVGGLRACCKKGGADYPLHEMPDMFCVQETKVTPEQVPTEMLLKEYPHRYWLAAEKDGYSGVGLLSKIKPLSVEFGFRTEEGKEHDQEGRLITAEYDSFYLLNTYVPNAGRKLVTLDKRMRWDPMFRSYVEDLDKKKPVIICGDMNVAHNEIDLKNPKTNKKNAGFTQEERDGFSQLLKAGFSDSFRHFYPKKENAYTFWTYMMNCRAKNVGWRLDYILVSDRLLPKLADCVIRDQVFGSDHCPLTLLLEKP